MCIMTSQKQVQHISIAIYIHQKATKLKPLRGKVSIIAHIVTIKSSAKKPWTLAFMWKHLTLTTQPNNIADQVQAMALPNGDGSPQQDNVP